MSRYRHLPLSLQGVFLVLAGGPLASVMATIMAWTRIQATEPVTLVIAAICYVVLPLGLATMLIKRHPAFLYLLIAECAGLLVAAFLRTPTLSPLFVNLHYGFVLTMVLLAVMLINRDILFPFIFTGHRGFRQAPRLAVNQLVRVQVPRINKTFEMMLEDCSLTGVALYGAEESLEPMLAANRRGDPLLVTCTIGRCTLQVPTTYLWQSRMSSIIKIGLVARDQAAMGSMFHALGLRQPSKRRQFRLAELYMTPWIRRALSYGMATFMLLMMLGLPILRELQQKDAKPVPASIAH